MQLDKENVAEIKEKLREISEAKSGYEIYRDFIISCKQSNVTIPATIKKFIVEELENKIKK